MNCKQNPCPCRTQPRTGDVYIIRFEGSGSVQRGLRPGVVISNNKGNEHSSTVIVLPMTTSLKKLNQPTHVVLDAFECGLKYTSMVLCENPQSVPKDSLGFFVSHLGDEAMSRISLAYLIAGSALTYIDLNTLLSAKKFFSRSGKIRSAK